MMGVGQNPAEIPLADSLPPRQRLVAIILAVAILVVILELVRRRKLREEYSLLWLITGGFLLLLTVNYRLLTGLTELIGATLPTSTLFFGGLIFLILVCLQFSVRLSAITRRLKWLNQKIALLEQSMQEQPKKAEQERHPLKYGPEQKTKKGE